MSVLSTQNSSAYGPLTRNRPSPPPLCPLRPSIILIHGGWQGPETYALLTPRLEKAGYSVFAPSLPSSGAEHAEPNFSGDVSVVRNAVLSTLKMGKDVVLIMHSYGAVVGCEALKDVMSDAELCELRAGGLKVGEVVRLGFVSGMVLPVGEATWNASHGYRPVPGFECVNNLIAVLDGSQRFYGDLPQEEARRWAERLKKQSRLALASPLTYAAYHHFPSSYLFCTEDHALPLANQQRLVALAGIIDTMEVAAGHSPHVSQPKAVERFIRKCAGETFAAL